MDKLNICFIVLSLAIFGSETVADGHAWLKNEKLVGDIAPLAYQIKLYDDSCLQYDRITKSLTGVPCDSYSNKQQFRNFPVDPHVEGRHENAISRKAAKIDIPKNSAFKEHRIPNRNNPIEGNNLIIWKSLDFGQSGSSRVALKFKSADVLSNFKGKVSVQVGDAPSVLLDSEANEASNSTEENVLNFDLKTLNGTQDVFLSLPSELSLRDIDSVHFGILEPDPKEHYVVAWKPFQKVLTIDADSKIAYVKSLSTGLLQKIRFENKQSGSFKLVLSDTSEVLEFQVDNANNHEVIAKPSSSSTKQLWYLEENPNGVLIISKYSGKKCLTVAKLDEKTPLTLQPCDGTKEQTWEILPFP